MWTGQTISVFGSQFTGVALPLIAALSLRAGPFEFGILNALGTAPFLLFGLVVGVWIDRWPRRPVLIAGDVGRGAIVGVVAVLAATGRLAIPHLYVTAFAGGVLTVFFDVAYQAYLPSLVDRRDLVDANSKLEITRAASQIAGPSLGGLIIQVVSAAVAMVVDAISFFVSGAFLVAIRRTEELPKEPRRPMIADLREGVGTVFGEPRLRAIAGCTATSNFFSAAIFSLYILFAVDVLRLSALEIGLVFGIGSVGSLIGALLAGRLARRFGVGPVIVWGSIVFGLAGALIALAAGPLRAVMLILGFILIGIGALVYNVNQVSLRQAITPNRLQGRMNATMRFLVWGTLPLGSLFGGVLGALIGIREAIAVGAVGGLLAFLWVAFSPVSTLQKIPELTGDA